MKKSILLMLGGIVLFIMGYVLKMRGQDFGDFLEGFGAGIFIVGIIQCIGSIVKSKQSQQS